MKNSKPRLQRKRETTLERMYLKKTKAPAEKRKTEFTRQRTKNNNKKRAHISKGKKGKNVIVDNILSKATCVMKKKSENSVITDTLVRPTGPGIQPSDAALRPSSLGVRSSERLIFFIKLEIKCFR